MKNYQANCTMSDGNVCAIPLSAPNLEDARKESLELAFRFGSDQRHPEPIAKIELYELVPVDTIDPQEKWTELLKKNDLIPS